MGREMPGALAVFDADGTLWREDVGEAFLRHLVSIGWVKLPDGSDPYEAYERAVDRDRAAGYAYAAQLQAGLEAERVVEEATTFARAWVPPRLVSDTQGLRALCISAGLKPFVVSASALPIVRASAPLAGFRRDLCRGIEVAVRDGRFTDEVKQPITYGEGKVLVAQFGGRLALACGDSFTGDLPMLRAAPCRWWSRRRPAHRFPPRPIATAGSFCRRTGDSPDEVSPSRPAVSSADRRREAQDELGALADAALHLDGAAVALHDALRDGQAQAGALGLRRVEGDEDAVERVLRDARAGVGEAHLDLVGRVARRRVAERELHRRVRPAGAHHQPAAVGHGLHRVERQVDEHLLELLGVGVDLRQPRRQVQLVRDVLRELALDRASSSSRARRSGRWAGTCPTARRGTAASRRGTAPPRRRGGSPPRR